MHNAMGTKVVAFVRAALQGAVHMGLAGFAQTPGDLVVWVPDAKILWVGNMIQAPSPALPWFLEGRHTETIATLTRVRDFLPEGATIIPGHGRPMRPADIEFPLRYLRELDDAVRAAIDAGRSVEATLEVAAMPHYGPTACLSGRIIRSMCPPPIVTYKIRQRWSFAGRARMNAYDITIPSANERFSFVH